MTTALPLPAVIDALAALRAVKDSSGGSVPSHLWIQCMRACNKLEFYLDNLHIEVPVEQPAAEVA